MYEGGVWKDKLGEPPQQAIHRFMDEGLLEASGLEDRMFYQFNTAALKSLAKKNGLKISGSKDALIQRLIENDKMSMRTATKQTILYKCSESGLKIVREYLENENANRVRAEDKIQNLLETGEFAKAVNVMAEFEASQISPRGLGVDWKNYDVGSDVDSLKIIFSATPMLLAGMEKGRLLQIRLAAGMMQLWGTNKANRWLPKEFQTGFHLDGDVASRMLVFYASHCRNMKAYKSSGIEFAEILGTPDSCAECQQINGKRFRLVDVPELPYAKCLCENGCRCIATATR